MESTPELKDWQIKWRCTACEDVVYSRYDGEFRWCKGGHWFVDQTPYYYRKGGEINLMEMVKE